MQTSPSQLWWQSSVDAVILATAHLEVIWPQNTSSDVSGFHAYNAHTVTLHMSESTGPSVGPTKQMIAALEDGKFIFLVPHVDSQGEVKGRGDDSSLVHPHGRDGPLVVLKGHQLQAVNGEEHQLWAGHQQDHLGAVALHEVRRHHGVWQQEARNLSYSFEEFMRFLVSDKGLYYTSCFPFFPRLPGSSE